MNRLCWFALALACAQALAAADAIPPAPGTSNATATGSARVPAASASASPPTAWATAPPGAQPALPGIARPPPPAPFLGVTLDRPSNFDANDGLLVTAVVPQSTFDHLGVRAGDHVLSANGATLNELGDFSTIADRLEVGQLLTLMVRSDTAMRTVSGRIEAVSRPREISQHTTQLSNEISQLREAVARQEPSRLNETLSVLKQLEADLPSMLDAFKKRYPNGRFNISIHIDILSDQGAANPTAVLIPPAPLPPGPVAPASAQPSSIAPSSPPQSAPPAPNPHP